MAWALAGCSHPSPSTDNLRNNIVQTIGGYSIKSLKCESFADKSQEAAGRSSCRGTLALILDRYASLPSADVQGLLVSSGIPQEAAGFVLQRHPKAVVVPAVKAGTETPFTSDCTYTKEVDGWRIGCNTSFADLPGLPPSAMGENYVLKDSPEYQSYIKEAKADFAEIDARFIALKSQIEEFFKVGRTVTATNPLSNGGIARVKIVSPLVWSGEPGFLGHQSQFSLTTKYVDLRDAQSSKFTFCGYAKGIPGNDIQFSGDIESEMPSRSAHPDSVTFAANLYMSNRAAIFENKFQSCGNILVWDGTSWKLSYGTLELKAN